VADGHRDLDEARSRKLRQFPSASRPKALNGRSKYGWYPSQMTKFRLSPPAAHAEIACGWNTIFGAQKSDVNRKTSICAE
jgi:hypothetical protein